MKTWGPNSCQGAISLTFDNFGEAAEIEFGLWPKNKKIGEHLTATQVLPQILSDLDRAGIKATFFIEAWNCGVYDKSIQYIDSLGHEIGLHGWRHEVWANQSEQRRIEILQQGVKAFNALDIHPLGFRPPGGSSTEDTPTKLIQHGFLYESALSTDTISVGVKNSDAMLALPFKWKYVDALYFEPFLSDIRQNEFVSRELRTLHDWQAVLDGLIRETLDECAHAVVVFHPYLMGLSPEQCVPFRRFINTLSAQKDIWVAPCSQVAQWIIDNP